MIRNKQSLKSGKQGQEESKPKNYRRQSNKMKFITRVSGHNTQKIDEETRSKQRRAVEVRDFEVREEARLAKLAKEEQKPTTKLTFSSLMFDIEEKKEESENEIAMNSDEERFIQRRKAKRIASGAKKISLDPTEIYRITKEDRAILLPIKVLSDSEDEIIPDWMQNSNLHVVSEKKSKARAFAEKKLKEIASKDKDLLFTKKGFIRSDADIAAIKSNTRKSRRLIADNKRRERLILLTQRAIERKRERLNKNSEFVGGGTAQVSLLTPTINVGKLVSQHKVLKEENQAKRKAFKDAQTLKKKRKQIKRSQRKVLVLNATTEGLDSDEKVTGESQVIGLDPMMPMISTPGGISRQQARDALKILCPIDEEAVIAQRDNFEESKQSQARRHIQEDFKENFVNYDNVQRRLAIQAIMDDMSSENTDLSSEESEVVFGALAAAFGEQKLDFDTSKSFSSGYADSQDFTPLGMHTPFMKAKRRMLGLSGKVRELIANVVEMLSSTFSGCDRVLSIIHDTVCYAYQMTQCRSKLDVYTCSAMYLSTLNFGVVSRAIIAILCSHLSSPTIQIETQGISTSLKKVSHWTKTILHSSLSNAFRDVVVSAASLHLFPKQRASQIYKYMGPPPRGSILDVLEIALNGFVRIVEVAELVISGVPLSEALFSDDPITEHIKLSEMWRQRSNLLYAGLPVDGRWSQVEFMSETSKITTFFKQILPSLVGRQKDSVNKELTSLLVSVNDVKIQMAGVRRKAPVGVILHGAPGIGKSNLLAFLTRIHCDVMKRKYSDRYMFARTLTSDYWEGYDPLSQPYIHYSEVGATHSNIVKSQGDPIITELTSLVDGTAYSCDMAFAGKGMTYANPELVLADTNCPDLNLRFLVKNPAAYERRFFYVQPKVKPQFVDSVGLGLDKVKAAAESDPYSLWTFDVYRFVPTSISTTVKQSVLQDGDITAFYDTMFDVFKKHEENETRVLDVITTALETGKYGTLQFDPKSLDNVRSKPSPVIEDDVSIKLAELVLRMRGNDMDTLPLGVTNFTGGSIVPSISTVDSKLDITTEAGGISDREWHVLDAMARLDNSYDNSSYFSHWWNSQSRFSAGWFSLKVFHFKLIVRKYWMPLFILLSMFFGGIAFAVSIIVLFIFCYEMPKMSNPKYFLLNYAMQYFPTGLTFIYWAFFGLSWKYAFLFKCISYYWKLSDIKLTVNEKMKSVRDESHDVMQFYYDYMLHLCGSKPKFKPYTKYKHYRLRLAITSMFLAGGALGLAYVAYKKNSSIDDDGSKDPDVEVESKSNFKSDETVFKELNEIETAYHCANSSKRADNKLFDTWNVFQSKFSSEVAVSDAHGVYRNIGRNCRRAIFNRDGIERVMHVTGLFSNIAIANAHSIGSIAGGSVKISKTGFLTEDGGYAETLLDDTCVVFLGNDLMLLSLSGVVFRDIRKFIAQDSLYPKRAKGIIKSDDVDCEFIESSIAVADKRYDIIQVNSAYTYTWQNHMSGMCGLPLFVQKDKGYSICGIHFAGHNTQKFGYASLINIDMIDAGVAILRDSSPLMPLHSESDEDQFDHLEPCKKSPTLHENLHGMELYGRQSGPIIMQKDSKLVETPFKRDDLNALFAEVFAHEPKTEFVPPRFKAFIDTDGEYHSAHNLALKKLAVDKKPCERPILHKIISELETKYSTFHKEKGITWTPMTVQEAINGSHDDYFLRGINQSTSAGYGWPGVKAQHTVEVEHDGTVFYRPSKMLAESIRAALDKYKRGVKAGFVFSASLKDEPRCKKKVSKAKIRVFWMSCLEDLVVSRMLLSPFYTAMVANSFLFNTCVGIDMHREAGYIFDALVAFAKKIMEGDYGKFDQSMPFDIGWAACSVIYRVCKNLGFCDEALRALAGKLTDSLFPIGEMNKDMFCSAGQQPSGKYGTAEDNGLRGLILLMYYYYWYVSKNNLDLGSFFDYVLPYTYGDDVLASVKPEIASWFNGAAYSRFVEEYFGMEFTTASKSADVQEFVDIEDMTFLKRKFRYHDDLGRVVAPLDLDSIIRSLQWRMPSKFQNESTQIFDTVKSALREVVFHSDEKKFTSVRNELARVYGKAYGASEEQIRKEFGDYWSYVESLITRDNLCPQEETVGGGRQTHEDEIIVLDACVETLDSPMMEDDVLIRSSDCGELDCVPVPVETNQRSANQFVRISNLIEKTQIRVEELSMQLDELKFDNDGMSEYDIRRSSSYFCSSNYRLMADEWIALNSEYRANVLTLERLRQIYSRYTRYNITTEGEEGGCQIILRERQDKRIYKFMQFLGTTYGHDINAGYHHALINGMLIDVSLLKALNSQYTSACVLGSSMLHGIVYRETQDKRLAKLGFFLDGIFGSPPGNQYNTASVLCLPEYLDIILRRYANNLFGITTEADDMSGPVGSSVESKYQTLEDMAGTEVDTSIAGFIEGSWQLGQTSTSLQDFFERPIEILATTVTLGSDYDVSFNPWSLFTMDPSVRAKLRNFAFLRGNLHIKIAVSGTQWHYGMLQCSYVPYHSTNAVYNHYFAGLPANRFMFMQFLSATLGSKTIDVGDNAPLEMSLPYMSTQPMIRLYNLSSSVLSAGTDYDDILNLGKVEIHSLVQPNAVGTSATSLGLNVFAWMTDVVLGCPTATQIEITTEADERRIGPVEKVASRANVVSRALQVVPWISSYAKASSIALSSLTDFASLLGFSYPTIISEPSRMRPDGYQNEANLIGYDTGHRITLDPLQEVSVDPRICSIQDDEMCLAYMFKTPALLSQFIWTPSNAPNTGLLWYILNAPTAVQGTGVSGGSIAQPSPLAFACRPFAFWRGDITYRIQIVCSKFHKGKLAFFFEPNISQIVLNTANLQFNKKHIVIVDIEQTRDISLCVRWAFPRAWAIIPGLTESSRTINDQADVSELFDDCNGLVGVVPFTNLQSPDGSGVTINVYHHSDNMQVNQVIEDNLPSAIVPPTSDITTEADERKDPTQIQDTCFDLNPTNAHIAGISEYHFGEMPVSWRALLKRFFFTGYVSHSTTVGNTSVFVSPIFPEAFPTVSTGIPSPYKPTLFNYLRLAFVGMTGGMRKRVRYLGMSHSEPDTVHVSIFGPSFTTTAITVVDGPIYQNNVAFLNGTTTFVPHVNSGFEFEIPFYTNNLFVSACADDPYTNLDPVIEQFVMRNYRLSTDATVDVTPTIWIEETAAAEDFRFVRFVAPPQLFWT